MSNSVFLLENMQQYIVTSFLFFVFFLNGTITNKNIDIYITTRAVLSILHQHHTKQEQMFVLFVLVSQVKRSLVCGQFHHSSGSCGLDGMPCGLLN